MPTDGKNEVKVALTRRRQAQELTGPPGNLVSSFCTTVHFPHDPAAVLLTILLREMSTLSLRKACAQTCRAALFLRAEHWKQPDCLS